MKKNNGIRNQATEDRLVNLGYAMIYEEDFGMAIAVFKLYVDMFPGSANAYDCLAEAYMKSGEKKKAISFYERALKIDPAFASAKNMLKELRGEK